MYRPIGLMYRAAGAMQRVVGMEVMVVFMAVQHLAEAPARTSGTRRDATARMAYLAPAAVIRGAV
jgi:hypothetical protein